MKPNNNCDWRGKLGKAPPLPLSLPAIGDDGQLLVTLAADIETLLNTRGAASQRPRNCEIFLTKFVTWSPELLLE